MVIPKIIYQTWKTKDLPKDVQNVRDSIQKNNPQYTMILYDDDDMDLFIKNNYDDRIYSAYKKLAVGAAKADLWRYLMLYKNGGIYLDIDSNIIGNLNDIIYPFDNAIITRENNPGLFTQWILIFSAGHPILKYTIDMCIQNIENKSSNDIAKITGPNVYSEAVNRYALETIGIPNPYYFSDEILNPRIQMMISNNSYKFYKIDMGDYANYKHDKADYYILQ